MNTGPLRRTTGTIGLIALTPVAGMLALGMLTAQEAAVRAVIVAVLVLVLGRIAQMVLRGMINTVERDADRSAAVGPEGGDAAAGAQPPIDRRGRDGSAR